MRKSASSDCADNRQTIVLEDSVVKGDINLPDGLCLFGKIVGNVTAGGRVEVMSGAVVSGQVSCRELYIEGTIDGDVDTCFLTIGDNAVLKGKVRTERLIVEGEAYDMKWLRLVRKQSKK